MIVSSGLVSHDPSTVFSRQAGFPLWTAGILLRGAATYTVLGQEHALRAPSVQLIAPGTAYRLSAGASPGPWVEAWAMLEPRASWRPLLRLPELVPGISSTPIPSHPGGRRMLRDAVAGIRLSLATPAWRTEIAENTLERLLIGIHIMLDQDGAHGRDIVDERVRLVEAALRLDFRRSWSIDDMAGLVHLSPSRFAHLFVAHVGTSPRSFLEATRMERARELLLSTNLPVQSISREVGFTDSLHFSARFRNRYGVSPTRFRHDPTTQYDTTGFQ